MVLDTNILISAYFWEGNEHRLLLACLDGRLHLVTSQVLLAELDRVLVEKFQLPHGPRKEFLRLIQAAALVVEPRQEINHLCDDPDDDRVLECAVEAETEWIITGDQHLLGIGRYRSIEIQSAREFLSRHDV